MTLQDPENAAPAASPRPRKGLRRLGWSLAALSGLAGALGALLLWCVGRPLAAPDWMRARIEARIAAAMPGMEIGFTGLSLIIEEGLQPRIRLRDVSLREAGGLPLVTLGDLEAGVSGEALLRGRLEPGRVILSGAQMTLRRMADGSFDLALGEALPPIEQAPSVVGLIEGLDSLLTQPRFAALSLIEAHNLGIRYEDARTGRAWQVDGGRLELRRRGDDLSLRGDVVLLSGYDYATSLSASYDSRIGSAAARIGLNFEDMTASDLAGQAPALVWLDVLRAPISGAIRAEVDDSGALGPMSMSLQIGEGVVQPTDLTQPIPFDAAHAYITYAPDTGILQFDDLSVRSKWITARAGGRASIAAITDGWPSSLLGQFRIRDIVANPAGLYDTPVRLEEALLDMRLDLAPFHLTLGHLTLLDQGNRLVLNGHVGAGDDGWQVAVDGAMDAVSPERVLQLWPEALVPNTRRWVAANVHQAALHDVQLAWRRTPDAGDRHYLGFGFDGAEVTYARDMPRLTDASGQASLMNGRFVISASSGRVVPPEGGALDVAGTSFIIPDVFTPIPPAQVRLNGRGSITAALSMLDSPPLRLLEKAGRPVDLAEGRAEISGLIDLPLKRLLRTEDLRFAATARLSGVRSDAIMPGRVLSAEALEVRADTDRLSIGGKGRIGQVPFEAVWSTAVRDNPAARSSVRGSVALSQAFLDEFRLGLPPGSVSGAGQAQIEIDLARDTDPAFRLDSDLAGVGLAVAPLGWALPAGQGGRLEVAGRLGTPADISRIALDAPGLSLTGALSLTAAGQLDQARFDRVQAGGWLDAPVVLSGRGAGQAPAVRIEGGRIDLRRSTLATAAGDGAQAGGPLSLALDRLEISDGIALTGFRGEFGTARGLDGSFNGQVNGKAAVTGRVVPMAGRSAFRIQSDDAGRVFAAAGLLKQARDGVMDLTLRPTGAPGSYDGALSVTGVRLREAPALAALFNAVSVVGLLEQMNGSGLHFSEVEADFLLTPDRVVLRSGSAVGASLGISMDGFYHLNEKRMDMQGVFSPIYMINGIGALLTRKGEGLFGFTYKLRGTPEAPRVLLNPLSALTPGMFREIFRRSPPV